MEQASLVNSRRDPDLVYARGGIGLQGPAGKGFEITGSVATNTDLVVPYTGKVGDIFVTLDDKHSHVWDGTAWQDLGKLQGEKGDTGDSGLPLSLQGKDTLTNILLKAGQPGDMWITTTTGTDSLGATVEKKDVLAWAEASNSWISLGQLAGPQGEDGLIGPEGLPGNDGLSVIRRYKEFHSTLGQTVFPITYIVGSDTVLVLRIGIKLPTEDYDAISGTDVVLHKAITADEDITIVVEEAI